MHTSDFSLGLNSERHDTTNHFGMISLSAQRGRMGAALVTTRLSEQELYRYPNGDMPKQGTPKASLLLQIFFEGPFLHYSQLFSLKIC